MKTNLLAPSDNILNTDKTVGDFWRWAYSDILCNTTRGVFAEYLVASALGVIDIPRIEWNAVDLYYKDKKIEVKTAAYLQNWKQDKLSTIQFDIAKKKSWFADTNTYSDEPSRPADCYVFCLLAEKDINKVNVLDVSQWEFFVVSTKVIDEVFRDSKSLSLKRLEKISEGSIGYDGLKEMVEDVFSSL